MIRSWPTYSSKGTAGAASIRLPRHRRRLTADRMRSSVGHREDSTAVVEPWRAVDRGSGWESGRMRTAGATGRGGAANLSLPPMTVALGARESAEAGPEQVVEGAVWVLPAWSR